MPAAKKKAAAVAAPKTTAAAKKAAATAPEKVIAKKAPAAKKAAATPKAPAAVKKKKPAAAASKKKNAKPPVSDDEEGDEEEVVVAKPAAKKAKGAGAGAGAGAGGGGGGAVVRTVDRRCSMGGVSVLDDYDAMLNQTNIGQNNNKFYVIQLLQTGGGLYHVWNRWGRVGEDGQHALKGPFPLAAAKKEFEKKFRDKTGNSWSERNKFTKIQGKYDLIKLKLQVVGGAAAAEEGGAAAKGKKGKGAAAAAAAAPPPAIAPSKLSKGMQEFIRYIFSEAKQSLTTSIDANITDQGIETPLGVLDLEQVAVGERILDAALKEFNGAKNGAKLRQLSDQFYTAIPHRFGRNVPPVLDDLALLNSKFELLALMKDMVKLSNKGSAILNRDDPDRQLASLGCDISIVAPGSAEHKEVLAEIVDSQKKSHGTVFVKVVNVFKVRRQEEHNRFLTKIGGFQRLYHGSRIANWVGLLSRGILMPKVVVAMGVHRTDPGWLGNGCYFGNADTAAGYAGVGKKGTAFMLMNKVALGKMKDYSKITYGLTAPPKGFDSTHGVAGTEFHDHEYVIYDDRQQLIEYLIEFKT